MRDLTAAIYEKRTMNPIIALRRFTGRRSRISHKHDGSIEVSSATAWQTPHQLAITANLRDAACDLIRQRSPGF